MTNNFRSLSDFARWSLRRMRIWAHMRHDGNFGPDIDYCLDNDNVN